ncbi:retrovirus-related pol polyprotein from transposon TNT 1-94 [Tanacetum coccineum]
MKEQAYNKIKTKNKTQELNKKEIIRNQRSLTWKLGISKETSLRGEIVSLKILSQKWKLSLWTWKLVEYRSVDQENYIEGCSMQRNLLEPNGFCFWKGHFGTYVKSKDIDLWQVIKNDDFYYEVEDSETKIIKETSYELLKDDQKKKLGKNYEAKMTLYNALPQKEYEKVFMCKTTKEVWHTLIITHQGNSQVKNCKIDLLTREYEKENVTIIKVPKDLATLPLDELIGNLKVYEMVLDNDGITSKSTKEKVKLLALEAKLGTSAGSSARVIDSGKAIDLVIVPMFGRGRKNSFSNKGGESSKPKGACYNCGIEGHFASECRKPKENKAFIGGAWSENEEDEKHQNDATCLMAIDSQEVDYLKFNVSKLQDEALNFSKFKESSIALDDMLSRQKLSQDKEGLGYSRNDKTTYVYLRCDLLPDDWIVDSGCTKHMTRNRKLFTSYKAYDGGHVIFGSNLKGKVVGEGNITHDSITITNFEHVNGLAFNLISVGQLCDDDCVVSLTKVDCNISKNGKLLAKGHRRNGLYTCKLGDNSKQQICLTSVVDNSMLWHRRLGHTNMRLVQNLASNELVRDLPKLSFERHFYDTCSLGSQGNVNNKTRNEVSTSRVLELLHLNLCGPSPIQSYGGNLYTLKIVDDH